MSPATIASLVFFAFSLMAAAALEFLLRALAEGAGVNWWVFAMVPALFAMLYSLIVYQHAERKIRRLSQSVSRGLLVTLLAWVSFDALTSWTWCQARAFGSFLRASLLALGVAGGWPIVLCALGAGLLTGILIIRRR